MGGRGEVKEEEVREKEGRRGEEEEEGEEGKLPLPSLSAQVQTQ